jgi:hypothetical protein
LAGLTGEDVRRAWVVEGVGQTADDELRKKIVDTMCSVAAARAWRALWRDGRRRPFHHLEMREHLNTMIERFLAIAI